MTKPKSCKGMLAEIRRFMRDENIPQKERKKFRDIQSALRGPDDGSFSKSCTTAIIRHYALGDDICYEFNMCCGADSIQDVRDRKQLFNGGAGSPHFKDHIRMAFTALGLELEKLNK